MLRLRDRFPGAELVLDGWRPFEIWVGNRYLSPSKFAGLMQWGLWSGREIEGWGATSLTGAGIRLLDEWGFLDESEPRLAHIRWLRPIESLFRAMRIYHFGLGKGPIFFRGELNRFIKQSQDIQPTNKPKAPKNCEALVI